MKNPVPLTAERALREALTAWVLSFALIIGTFLLYRPMAKAIATACFLYVPLWFSKRQGEDVRDYGLRFDTWRQDLRLFVRVTAVLIPLFFVGFWAFTRLLPLLPMSWAQLLTPLRNPHGFAFTLPPDFHRWVVDQLLVVALPEEFFYRGFIQTRLRAAWPHGRMLWGGRLGPAFWVTAVLFALGHLAVFEAWRLAVFFPALLFGWMRERNGSVIGPALLHAFCNLYEMVLEASFF